MSLKYINLPIYSIAVFGEYIYFAGGGGGSTGIPNQIQIYHKSITSSPVNNILTDKYIIQNLTVIEERNLVICNANDHIVVYEAIESGRGLVEKYRFKADFSIKSATINAICADHKNLIISTGGDDMIIRFFQISQQKATLVHEYNHHSHSIKNIDFNEDKLFLSTDNHLIVIYNLEKKQIVKQIYQDQLLPSKSMFLSAYFAMKNSHELIITHFILRKATYITKTLGEKLKTVEVLEDQSCQTAYHRDNKVLGIGCGNGTTLMFDTHSMECLGTDKNHKSVITGCTITKKTQKFLTGTSQCSYNIQSAQGQLSFNWALISSLLLTFLLIFLLGNYNNMSNDDLQL